MEDILSQNAAQTIQCCWCDNTWPWRSHLQHADPLVFSPPKNFWTMGNLAVIFALIFLTLYGSVTARGRKC